MKKLSLPWIFVAFVVALPVTVFALVNWYQKTYQALPVLGPEGHRVDGFSMTNQYGQKIENSEVKSKAVITNFFFTHCPAICPKMTRNLKRVQQVFINDDAVLINSFSVDPVRDSVERLSFYGSQFNIKGRWNLLTGDKKEIYRLARKSFLVVATDGDGGPGDFIHSDKLILTDAKGRIRGYYDGTSETETAQLIKDIDRLKAEKEG